MTIWHQLLITAFALSLAMSVYADDETVDVEDGDQITLNLQNAEITALINTVADITGRNFIIDPRVRGTVTVVTSRPMDEDELYRVFLSVLEVHGFATIPTGDIIKVIPDANAKQLGTDGEPEAPADIVTAVIPVDNVPVAQLVPILRPLVPQNGHLAAYPPTNVLIASDRAGNLERIRHLVEQVDRAGDAEIDIVPVENASATEVARILRSLQRGDAEGVPGRDLQIAVDERTGSILLSGEENQRQRMRRLITELDEPDEDQGDTHVIYLRYARAEDLVDTLTGVSENIQQRRDAQEGDDAAPVSIQADEATNALIISAQPNIVDSLLRVIERLDIRRAQIMVEAAIAEISTERDAERGVQWFVDGGEEGALGLTRFGNIGTPIESLLTLDTDAPQLGDGVSAVIGDLDSRVQFGAFVRALSQDRNTNILSTPSLVTMDNQEAEIRVAENRPFVTGQFSQEGRTVQNPFQTISREDVGIILKITPQINEGDAIRLDIEQEASNVIGQTTAAGPITNRRTIQTSVLAEDGQIIALGGLMDDDVQEEEQRVPGLGSIPLLGELFRYRSTSETKRNLMVFMQPNIIRDRAMADGLTGRKYSYMRARQLAQRDRDSSLLSNPRTPTLPQMERPELPVPFSSSR
ncbi:type II secretion system secretin GspD [Aquisalimonas sp.]|uniref:type II secretion system secretin GspD n=1 Tax=Aquisalimonas sp. TaxID=1872621 RepID=UPI0025BC2927|nr:type II secretion system secretin GspD [Aquisalimonas sp.]